MMEVAQCMAADLVMAAPPGGPHWTEHLPRLRELSWFPAFRLTTKTTITSPCVIERK